MCSKAHYGSSFKSQKIHTLFSAHWCPDVSVWVREGREMRANVGRSLAPGTHLKDPSLLRSVAIHLCGGMNEGYCTVYCTVLY